MRQAFWTMVLYTLNPSIYVQASKKYKVDFHNLFLPNLQKNHKIKALP